MLNDLKRNIRKQQNAEFVIEAAIDHTDDNDIKDIFLDDTYPDADPDDEEIDKLIDEIPEYNDDIEDTNQDLDNITENYIPESKI